ENSFHVVSWVGRLEVAWDRIPTACELLSNVFNVGAHWAGHSAVEVGLEIFHLFEDSVYVSHRKFSFCFGGRLALEDCFQLSARPLESVTVDWEYITYNALRAKL